MSVPLLQPIQRMHAGPLQTNEYFTSLVDAQIYAISPTAIVGQTVTVVNAEDTPPIKKYVIQPNKTLELVGSGEVISPETLVHLQALKDKLLSEGYVQE